MSLPVSPPVVLRLLQAVAYVWAGLVLGVSFLEAPVKFTAPSVTRAIGLDVGRHVFAALNRVEIGLGGLALAAVFGGGAGPAVKGAVAAAAGILALQTGWLLPVLRKRAGRIVEGRGEPEGSYAHRGYVALEVAKVAGLLWVGWSLTP